ncbi:MAG TPA: hypothetical protein VJ825_14485 [Gemmatimonadaceae bacterium]|nr:hypothetical protein [Gemmatimonadaceae bacterium]
MKLIAIALAVSAVGSAASLNAQTIPGRAGTAVPSTDCSYARTSNSVGDIIFGRTNIATTCRDVYSREDGAWYQVGRGAHNNSIYERRIRSTNGSLIIQRARRNPNGTFTILSSRSATTNDKEWRKAEKARQKAWKKQQKAEEKAQRKADREYYKHR